MAAFNRVPAKLWMKGCADGTEAVDLDVLLATRFAAICRRQQVHGM